MDFHRRIRNGNNIPLNPPSKGDLGGCWVGAALLLSCAAYAGPAQDLYLKSVEQGQYRMPTDREMRDAQSLFERMFATPEVDLKEAWAALHFDAIELNDGDCTATAIQESADAKQGRGFYLIRKGARVPLALEMPHCPSDLHTETIGFALFREAPVAAAAWNTIRRDAHGETQAASADLAHAERSILTAFSLAFARSFPQGRIAQLHGFAKEDHAPLAAQGIEMVLSAGIKTPSDAVKKIFPAMERAFPGKVLLYTKATKDLGGTTNAQGKALRASGNNCFVHVEMDQTLRKKLKNDSKSRAAFAEALQEGLGK